MLVLKQRVVVPGLSIPETTHALSLITINKKLILTSNLVLHVRPPGGYKHDVPTGT